MYTAKQDLFAYPDESRFEQLGTSVDVEGNYMIAGMPENSAQAVYSGRVIVYKFDVNGKWVETATLTPSDPAKHLQFGSQVAISGNSIAILGREYNDDGIPRSKLYIFEKGSSDEWSTSSESYVIAKPFGTISEWETFGQFDILNNELVAISYKGTQSLLEVYAKSGGVFSLSQSITTPANSPGFAFYQWNLALDVDIIALATEQYQQADHSNGGAFIYTKNAGLYSTVPVALRAAGQNASNWEGFGVAVAISNNTVFVQGIHTTAGPVYNQSIYVFEKPPAGWVDTAEPLMLQSPGYVQSNARLVANENYVFTSNENYKGVLGFKKPASGWSAGAIKFEIGSMTLAEGSNIGRELKLNGNHLVLGCPNRFSYTSVGNDLILACEAPAAKWETPDVLTQEIHHTNSINATDDFFGKAFSVNADWLAISAERDDTRGSDTGVVNLFDAKGSQVEPIHQIFNPELENYSSFGHSLAIGDSILFIGAPYKDSLRVDGTRAFSGMGKVYVYRLTADGWKYSSQMVPPNLGPQINFGRRIVWTKGYCAVTEFYQGDSERVGKVHIYKENEATKKFDYLATLEPAFHQRADFFGNSLVMNDSLIVIGTGHIAPDVSYRKNVYVFRKKGEWKTATEDARLFASDGGWNDRFGTSVSMHGKYIVVGAPYSPGYVFPMPPGRVISGAVYVFKQPANGWRGELTEIARITPSDPKLMDKFGMTVAIDHTDIFVGAPGKSDEYNVADNLTNHDNALHPGKVYHYKKPPGIDWQTTNQEVRQVESFEPEYLDGYGASIYVSDRYLYVGAHLDDNQSGLRAGSVQTMMQLPVVTEVDVQCLDQSPFKLQGFPKNGNWSGPGVNPVTGMFNPSAAGAGIHTIIYERSGCEATVQIEVQANVVNVITQSPALQTKCMDAEIPVILQTNRSAGDYRWYFKAGLNDALIKIDSFKQEITATLPGYYQVVIDRGVCPDRVETFQVLNEAAVDIDLETVPVLCDDQPWQLIASPTSGQWDGEAVSASGTFNPAGLENGSYKARYNFVTSVGCHWKDSIMVTVDKLKQPVVEYTGEEICGDKPVQLTALNIDEQSTLGWFGPDGNKITNATREILGVNEPGAYTVEAKKSFCTLMSLPVMVTAVADSMFIPNVFTANNDNVNDFFEVRSNGIEKFSLTVINRYGRQVFQTNDVNFRWSGENVSPGIYYWTAQYTTCWNKEKSAKGWVQLIR
ncbi:MAG: gliding motility-associated C-terminal domain-containing protein [Cyclobacteriaceae bacterium]